MKLRLKSCTLAHDGTGELKEGLIFNPFKKSPTSRPSRYSQRELAVKSSCAVIIRHAPAPNSPLRLELKNFSSGLDWLGSSSTTPLQQNGERSINILQQWQNLTTTQTHALSLLFASVLLNPSCISSPFSRSQITWIGTCPQWQFSHRMNVVDFSNSTCIQKPKVQHLNRRQSSGQLASYSPLMLPHPPPSDLVSHSSHFPLTNSPKSAYSTGKTLIWGLESTFQTFYL